MKKLFTKGKVPPVVDPRDEELLAEDLRKAEADKLAAWTHPFI